MSTLIVGAGPGLGAALARRFGRAGERIGLVARSPDALRGEAEALAAEGVETAWRCADAGDPTALKTALEALQGTLGRCTTLIYNATVMRAGAPLTLEADRLHEEFAVNVVGASAAVQASVSGMIARQRGTILFTGGGLALEPYPEWTSLALGKAALRSYAFSLHKELAPFGVHVAVVAVCGVIKPGGPFDPDRVAEAYYGLATGPRGLDQRELVFRPPGADPYYNDPTRRHAARTPVVADGR